MTAEAVKCSRAGCRSTAVGKVVWRNPRIHSENREKHWLYCAEHQVFLVDYLSTRGFFLRTEELK
jgi:hypothetical protein